MTDTFRAELDAIVGARHVLHQPVDVLTYECDALAHLRELPVAVVMPGSAEEVQQVVCLAARERVPFVARGHGTGLSGGALGGFPPTEARQNRVGYGYWRYLRWETMTIEGALRFSMRAVAG